MNKPIYLNTVVCLAKKRRFRIIDHIPGIQSPNNQNSWVLIELDVAKPMPECWSVETLSYRLSTGTLVIEEPSEPPEPPTPKASDILIRNKRWSHIKDLVKPDEASPMLGRRHELYDRQTRNKLLIEHATYLGICKEALLNDLRLYWVNGLTTDSLLGCLWRIGRIDWDDEDVLIVTRKGEEGSSQVAFAPGHGRARGRRPNSQEYEPYVMTKAVRSKVLQVARKHFLEDESCSLRNAVDQTLRKLYCLRDEKGRLLRGPEEEAILPPHGQYPSESQVRYLLRKSLSPSEAVRLRINPHTHANDFASSTGTVHDDCKGPGDIYEIDATIVDLWLVSEADGTTIIGKATLYLVIDRATSLIVGFYLSLEPPKWEEAKQAVLSISGDWEALCKRLGVVYRASAFPAVGVYPNRWVGDRGEMLSFGSDILTAKLRQDITNLPARAARKKCIVEGGFHTSQLVLKDNADGYSFPRNAKKRQGKKYEKDACLTLTQLAKIYLELVIAHNLKPRTARSLKADEVFGMELPTPASQWTKGVAQSMGALAQISYEYARRRTTPRGVATVTQHGIEFRDLRYSSVEAKQLDWFTKAKRLGQFPASVEYSPSLVNAIIVRHPEDETKSFSARLIEDHRKSYSGWSFAEIDAAKKKSSDKGIAIGHRQRAYRMGLAESVEEISAPAHAAMKVASKGVALGTRMRGGKAAAKEEVHQRRQDVHDISKTPSSHVAGLLPSESDVEAMAEFVDRELAADKRQGCAPTKRRPRPETAKADCPEAYSPDTRLAAATTSPMQPRGTAVLDDLFEMLPGGPVEGI